MDKSNSLFAAIDQRTRLAGENRMELLLFSIAASQQKYGINVFKVREIMHCPPQLMPMPGSSKVVLGVMDFRGEAIAVIDFSMAIWGVASPGNLQEALVIIAEHNGSVQALLVQSVDRIINVHWQQILTPPVGARAASGSYLTAITSVDEAIVEIIDVERIVEEIHPCNKTVSSSVKQELNLAKKQNQEKIILIADDSSVARSQIKRCIDQLNLNSLAFNDGKQALDYLQDLVRAGSNPHEEILMIISDVEMPVMDGYTLTTEIRKDAALKELYIILHTSLSGVFNESLVKKVGANNFIAKFQPDILAKEIKSALHAQNNGAQTNGGGGGN
jgi:two-component system chemotaxis response regulator CheV